jgi:class 3 adenylate cyclase
VKSDKLIRWSAIASSIVALGILAAWFLSGANLVVDASKESYLISGAWRAIMAATSATAAITALILLTRGFSVPAAVILGTGLGWMSLSVTAMTFLTLLSDLQPYLQSASVGLMALYGLSIALLGFAISTMLKFAMTHPRAVTVEDLAAFFTAEEQRDASRSTPLVARLYRSSFAKFTLKTSQNVYRQFVSFMSGRLFLNLFLALALPISAFWSGNAANMATGTMPKLAAIAAIAAIVVNAVFIFVCLLTPTVLFMMIFHFHKVLGTPQEMHKVEWIGMASSLSKVLVLASMTIWLLFFLIVLIEPKWIDGYQLQFIAPGSMVAAFGTMPLFLIIALGLSVLYRGTLDPRLVLGRFTLWTALGLILTFIFVLIERAVSLQVMQWFQLPPQTGGLVAGAMIAATFQPIRKRTEVVVTGWVSKVMPAAMLTGSARLEAAVVVTDITGYTALSARDEPSALLASALVQKEARHLCDAHDGQFVKSTGDGAIMFFHTADEAMLAITALHAAISQASAALKIPFELHSGVHWGEFVQAHDGDIYGQTVNVAARIADRAKASEIWTSASFASRLIATSLPLVAMGLQQFKNVPEGVSCSKVGLI